MESFSSKQYSWSSITVAFGGRIIKGCIGIEYTEKIEKEFLYGRGNKPHSIQEGNRSYEGNLSLWQSVLEAMIRDAKDKDILNLSFDLIVSYIPKGGGQMVTDILKDVEFTELKKGMQQGDKNMKVELPIMFLDIQKQV